MPPPYRKSISNHENGKQQFFKIFNEIYLLQEIKAEIGSLVYGSASQRRAWSDHGSEFPGLGTEII